MEDGRCQSCATAAGGEATDLRTKLLSTMEELLRAKESAWAADRASWEADRATWEADRRAWNRDRNIWNAHRTSWEANMELWDAERVQWKRDRETWQADRVAWRAEQELWAAERTAARMSLEQPIKRHKVATNEAHKLEGPTLEPVIKDSSNDKPGGSDGAGMELGALENDVILRSIFKFLSTRDLLECRQLNHRWNLAAVATLKLRPIWAQIRDSAQFEILGLEMQRRWRWEFPFLGLNLEETWNRGLRSGIFEPPIHPRPDPQAHQVRKFLQSFGKSLKRLALQGDLHELPLLDLLSSLPNLELMDLSKFRSLKKSSSSRQSMTDGDGSRFNFPNLKILRAPTRFPTDHHVAVQSKRRMFEQVLRAAPKLIRIVDFSCYLADALPTADALKAVHSFNMRPFHERLDVAGARLLLQNPLRQISKVMFKPLESTEWKRMDSVVQSEFEAALMGMLRASRDSLQDLTLNSCHVEALDVFPVMSKLRSLTLGGDFKVLSFPSTLVSLRSLFPFLRRVRLELTAGNDSNFLYEFLPIFGSESFDTVEELEIGCQNLITCEIALWKTFPNVTTVRINWANCYPSRESGGQRADWNILRQFTRIDKLEIFNLPIHYCDRDLYFTADSLLEGIFHFLLNEDTYVRDTLWRQLRLYVVWDRFLDTGRVRPHQFDSAYSKESWKAFIAGRPFLTSRGSRFVLDFIPYLEMTILFDFRHESAECIRDSLQLEGSQVGIQHAELGENNLF